MFAQLGDIKFDLLNSFNSFTETNTYNYAKLERINNKPVLQFLGVNLQEENIKINFHNSFCIPEEEIKKIKDAADLSTPLNFIKGNGEYVGIFVIEEIFKQIEQAAEDGSFISVQMEIRLVEYTGKIPEANSTDKGFKRK